jgi:hypothetical protein
MSATMLTLAEVRRKGLEILARELGPVDYIRFMRQFESGRGDYTKERRVLLEEMSLEEAISLVEDWEKELP